ncbi:1-deoxy-D-xylulose-5-phosphate synthase [Micromonospora echinofusca]|uniref:1-deoxy-D-xylulose-5-phosphate synthase n=1 Tax=Micromonospora echinofusca TaxID=47858 RepID=A0ABS3VPC7_MICEH|nr:1-deoxy-D-xylulose-5-phosphate synthase [Micromonospora echinofusca]MBO4206253.1 1-deoxy-D-xylulose-5-phosphate synthase [Micromonospora echinofusca]
MLSDIHGPDDLRRLSPPELDRLCGEIRSFLVQSVTRTGGHLGPNLGVVELTLALHRVFDSPRDGILWDTGHQAYVHKLLTGRQDFSRLRKSGGLSGYPSREESPHDLIENSHASTALSYADGLARAYQLRGVTDRRVVAVVGDGALTGGMAWEALNNIASAQDRPVVIVINDNGRSYARTIGGLARHLDRLRTSRGYEDFLRWGKHLLGETPVVGRPVYDLLHSAKRGLRDLVMPEGMFVDLGLKYLGPVDGHDIAAMESALTAARDFGGPVVVHCVTRKGRGYRPAEDDERDCFHGIGVIDPETGRGVPGDSRPSWTSVFADEMARVGAERADVVAITAAMLHPVGLQPFADAHPDRVFDVGIAEQHAVTCAAGLAAGGLHPVVAVYATFLNRAFDQVLLDVALHRAGVTFVLDRAGVTGDDGPSHNGMWDMSVLGVVPGLRIAAPRDGTRLRAELGEALAVSDAPTVLRYPKGPVPEDTPAVARVGGVDLLTPVDPLDPGNDVLLVSVGAMAQICLETARRLADRGVRTTVVDPRWVKPIDPALLDLAGRHALVAVVEDNVRHGGIGAALSQAVQDEGLPVPCRTFGIPSTFLDVGSRSQILSRLGLTAEALADELGRLVLRPLTAS